MLAALGLVVSPRRRDVQRSVFLSGEALTAEALAEVVSELGEHARRALGDAGAAAPRDLRAALPRPGVRAPDRRRPRAPTRNELREAFEAEHEDRYGYRDPDQELELVTIRVTATVPGVDVALARDEDRDDAARGRRTATLGGEQLELEVLRGAPPPGTSVAGPAVVELPESTLLVPAGWSGEVDQTGTISLRRER